MTRKLFCWDVLFHTNVGIHNTQNFKSIILTPFFLKKSILFFWLMLLMLIVRAAQNLSQTPHFMYMWRNEICLFVYLYNCLFICLDTCVLAFINTWKILFCTFHVFWIFLCVFGFVFLTDKQFCSVMWVAFFRMYYLRLAKALSDTFPSAFSPAFFQDAYRKNK